MKRTIVAGESCAQPCADCTVRVHAICAALEQDELRELEQLGQRLQYRPNEPVFTQEEIAGSCYNVLEGVVRLYKLLPDGRRQIVGFALPGDFLGIAVNGRHGISADAVGPVAVCRFAKKSFSRFVGRQAERLASYQRIRHPRSRGGPGPDGAARAKVGGREGRDLPGQMARPAGAGSARLPR